MVVVARAIPPPPTHPPTCFCCRSLHGIGLTGTLPPQLFRIHPRLSSLLLTGNQLSGTLPQAWASAKVGQLLNLQHHTTARQHSAVHCDALHHAASVAVHRSAVLCS